MPDAATPLTIRDFINEQMRIRDMSQRQFADFIGVGKSTLSRIMDPQNPAETSIEFLDKLATATAFLATALLDAAKRLIASTASHHVTTSMAFVRIAESAPESAV